MVEKTEEDARKLHRDILVFRSVLGRGGEVLYLPPPDGPSLAGQRALVVHAFSERGDCSVVTSAEALGGNLWNPGELASRTVALEVGDERERDDIEDALRGLGYQRVPLVTEVGQYSRRGFIIDVFTAGGVNNPLRVEFFGDRIESIRTFDVESQRSMSTLDFAAFMPCSEPDGGISLEDFAAGLQGFAIEGVFEEPSGGTVVLSRFAIEGEGVEAGTLPVSGLGILPEERNRLDDIARSIKKLSRDHRVVIVASSRGQAERLNEILRDGDVIAPLVEAGEVLDYEGWVTISTGELSAGLRLPGLLVLTEQEIFGGRPSYRPLKKSKVKGLLARIEDLEKGDLVVHYDHGIGRFEGMRHQSVEGMEMDLLSIEYADGGRLYLPIYAIDMLKKYHSEEASMPKLDRLGAKTWQRKRERVRKRIREMASKLLKIYAERQVSRGVRFSPDTEMHREFDSFFPYEETPDQLRAIREIKADMESERPMDRLLAGDVGYGKTEVAMRAAFKAVYDNMQVAVLVPTTLLCEQHLRIFRNRFAAFPVSIDFLSRFKKRKEQLSTIEDIRRGKVDIVIATHALLREDISFRRLGLLIVDEEHRFGVRQKEKIKEIKRGVDVLSMSATPIPRTLQMSLSGIRSMSVIETPPEERVAVKSKVYSFADSVIAEALERELQRGGQAFFVHNRIHDIEKYLRLLKRLSPHARVAVAHGRMTERALEEVMLSFLNREIDVLVSTAIVGSGLDFPSANTIMIDMAHRMGLADLYQLKGRVGRSNVRAYAYFLIPGGALIPEDAMKRLQAIQELNYMGAGFRLAMKDLEIRGAGNLLGAEQSGYIDAVGFDLYIEMLEKAVAELKGTRKREHVPPSIKLRLDAFIPESYMEDMTLRLSAYRAVASAGSGEELDSLREEMRDRFGDPPEAFLNLLTVMEMRLLAEPLDVTDVTETSRGLRFTFSPKADVRAERIAGLFGKGVRFFPDGFEIAFRGSALEALRETLDGLSGTD
jgi:transcription-repair coupling factor (superfamily II helicase)